MEIEYARNIEAPFPVVEPNPRCVRYDCTDCHGNGYVEGWIGVDPATLRCPGNGVIEPWKPIMIVRVREYMKDWTSYTAVMAAASAVQTDDALFFTARNYPNKERVELKVGRDPDVVNDRKQVEYYFNIWERPAGTEEAWEWMSAIQAELKPKPKPKPKGGKKK